MSDRLVAFDNRAVGARSAVLRRRAGHSQRSLAAVSGISRVHLCNVERGHRALSIRSLQRLAHVLRVRPGAFLDAAS